MPEAFIPLLKGDRVSVETDYRDSLPVNMSAVIKPLFGAQGYMIQEYGLRLHGTGLGIDRRGLWNERQQNHYRISGNNFVSVAANGTVTNLAGVGAISGTDTASMPYSFQSQVIIADGRMWRYPPGGPLTEIVDPDLGDPIDGVWIDGYYFLTDGESIYHTLLADETQIDPLQFATSEFSPDPTLGVAKNSQNQVLVFNRYSTEYFVNRANPNFAFTRLASRAVKAGIVGTHAKCEINDNFYILGGRKEEDVSVHVLGLGDLRKIATREIEKIINAYSESQLSTAVLESRNIDGYNHLIVHLPNEVLMFNVTAFANLGFENCWTILKTDVLGDAPWRAKFGVFDVRLGEWVYGDKLGANIGILDRNIATQYDQIVEWILFTPFLFLEDDSIDSFEVETIPGFNIVNDATVAFSLTYDGITFGLEWFKEYGVTGDYSTRFILNRLGYIRDWFAIKLRGATRTRMAFCRAKINHG